MKIVTIALNKNRHRGPIRRPHDNPKINTILTHRKLRHDHDALDPIARFASRNNTNRSAEFSRKHGRDLGSKLYLYRAFTKLGEKGHHFKMSGQRFVISTHTIPKSPPQEDADPRGGCDGPACGEPGRRISPYSRRAQQCHGVGLARNGIPSPAPHASLNC